MKHVKKIFGEGYLSAILIEDNLNRVPDSNKSGADKNIDLKVHSGTSDNKSQKAKRRVTRDG